jgi:hypothetical protein
MVILPWVGNQSLICETWLDAPREDEDGSNVAEAPG